MAILEISTNERPGILKEIDEGALDLVFQAIQEDIYSFPIRSFVREAISNGLDAITERKVYEAIQAGKSQEEFYRQKQDGKLLKDSAYDENYYSPKHLDKGNDRVTVTYTDCDVRDTIAVKDYGVGLGGQRLKGYFKLGYSSKRNMKDVIGKFGAGAKAGLSTGVEYFIVNTVYNGYKTSFMIFKNDYDPITPYSGETNIIDVWIVKLADGTTGTKTVYWHKTNEKNSVEVVLEVKKHNKQNFLNAVRDQFQYFKGRVCLNHHENGSLQTNFLDEKPLHETDVLLIPKYSTYGVPHILVDGISYGPISWPELELENRSGKIALKVKATEVDITQSREALKWTEKTKGTILNLIGQAREQATDFITEKMALKDPENLLEANVIYGNMGKRGGDEVSAVFSKFLDMHNLKPKFTVKSERLGTIKATIEQGLFDFLFYNYAFKRVSLKSLNGGKIALETYNVENFEGLRDTKIVYGDASTLGPKLADHLLNSEFNVESLVYVRARTNRTKDNIDYNKKSYDTYAVNAYTKALLLKYVDLNLDTYDVQYNEDTEELDDAVISSPESLAKIRKMNQEILYTHYPESYLAESYNKTYVYVSTMTRITLPLKNLERHFEDKEIVITTSAYKDLANMVQMSELLQPSKYPKKPVKIIFVAKENVQHFLPYGTFITDYFRKLNTNTGELMIGEHIRNLNTRKKCEELKQKYPEFAFNYSVIKSFTGIQDEDLALYKEVSDGNVKTDIKEIMETAYKMPEKFIGDIMGYLDTLAEFHDVVRTGVAADIESTAKRLFNSDQIYTIDAYDERFITLVETELARLAVIEPVFALFTNHTTFTDESKNQINSLLILKTTENDHI